jgi:hypothetical protein
MYGMRDFTIFEIHVSATFERRARDEFGWVAGCEPGNGQYHNKPEIQIHRIVCKREEQAKERALESYRYGSGAKDLEIVKVDKHKIDALILEFGS